MKAKCVKFYEFGEPTNVLKVENKNIHPPLRGEVLARMKVRPINPSDLIPIRGAYSHRISLPIIPGYEGVGVIEDVGEGVSRQLIGRRVLPLRGEGTWQEFVRASADLAITIPNSINDYEASQLYINPITAWVVCTEILKLKPGDTLLVNAGGSSISRIFAQLSRIIGFRMIGVTRNNHYTSELLQLGAFAVINTSQALLYDSVMELTNGFCATSAIDSIGGPEGAELACCVRPKGDFLTIGLLSGIPVDWKAISQKTEVNFKLFHLRHWNQQISIHTWHETFERLITFITEKKLALMRNGSQYNLLDVNEAVHMSDSPRQNTGKIFLTS